MKLFDLVFLVMIPNCLSTTQKSLTHRTSAKASSLPTTLRMENRRHLHIDISQDDYAFIDQLRRIAAARNGANQQPQSSFGKGLAKLEEQHEKKHRVSKLDIIGQWTLQAATAETCGICYYQNWDHCITCQAEAGSTSPELICLCDTTSGICGHLFHTHCITRWLAIRNACPICDLEGSFFGLQWRVDVDDNLQSKPLRPSVPFPMYAAQPLHQPGPTGYSSGGRRTSGHVRSDARNVAWSDKPIQAKSPSWPWADGSTPANTAPYPHKSVPLELPIRSRPFGQKPMTKKVEKPVEEVEATAVVENEGMEENKKKEQESRGEEEDTEKGGNLKAEEQRRALKEEKEKKEQKAVVKEEQESW